MKRPGEAGIAMIVALFFALTVMALVSATILSGVAVVNQSRYQRARQEAQLAAESGVHLTVARLGGPERDGLLAAGEAEGVLRGTGPNAARYWATLVPAGKDGVDNDQDSEVDEEDEADLIELTSVGSYDRVTRTVRVTLATRYDMPVLPAALYFDDPLASLRFNGTAFTISGHDTDFAGHLTGVVKPAIAVNGPIKSMLAQITARQEARITGAGGTPSIATVEPLDLKELIDDGARSASVTLAGGSGIVRQPAPGAWGTLAAPTIIYGEGSIHISGGAKGVGVLLVNGDLTITGGFEWRGLIIVGGEVTFQGGGGGKRLVGALIVNGDLKAKGIATFRKHGLLMGGTVDIQLSLPMIDSVSRAFAAYTILNWREGPVPLDEALP